MNALVWAAQVGLAVVSALHGWMFAAAPGSIDTRLRQRQPDAQPIGLPTAFLLFIGVAEIAAAAGLILPGALGLATWLTPLAALGFAIILAGASVTHARRGEPAMPTAILSGVALAVAFIRWRVLPL